MKQSFIDIIEENRKIIYKVCNMYCKTDTDKEDLYQDIILRLWKGFDSFKGRSKISTWIYRVSINTAITNYRLNERKPKVSSYETKEFSTAETATDPDLENEIDYLLECIDQLNDIEKAIILLYLDEIPYKEIAGIVGISYTNVATRISRIKGKLKKIMETR